MCASVRLQITRMGRTSELTRLYQNSHSFPILKFFSHLIAKQKAELAIHLSLSEYLHGLSHSGRVSQKSGQKFKTYLLGMSKFRKTQTNLQAFCMEKNQIKIVKHLKLESKTHLW